MKKMILEYCEKYNFKINQSEIDKIIQYYELLIFYQKKYKINLTRIIEKKDFVIKNVLDTLFLNQNLKNNIESIVDMGTGNGIPGIFIAIFNSDKKIVLIDSTKKKIKFVDFIIKKLKLLNCKTYAERIEVLSKQSNIYEKFDCVIVRALAELKFLLELSSPLLKLNGELITQKGKLAEEELKKSEQMVSFSGFEFKNKQKINIENNKRILLKFVKIKKTPDIFPRFEGDYKSKPIKIAKKIL